MKYYFFLLVVLFPIFSVAQINETIKDKAQENKERKSGSSSSGGGSSSNGGYNSNRGYSNSYYDGGSGSSTGCFDAADCCVGGFELATVIISGLGDEHRKLLAKADSVKEITSFAVDGNAGAFNANYYVFRPKLIGRYGLFSTELRGYLTFEPGTSSPNQYHTIDWQILLFNIVNSRRVHLKLGGGIMYEDFTELVHPEVTFGGKVKIAKDWQVRAEGRMALGNEVWVRQEANAAVDKLLYKRNNFNIYLSVGGLVARYYEAVDLWSAGPGFYIQFD